MAYNWKRIHRLIYRFGDIITFKKLISETYSEDTGERQLQFNTITLLASIQPIKKKGSIGGEIEVFVVFDETGSWEKGAFIMYAKSDTTLDEYDEVQDLTLNGKNYGDAFIDRVQDWSNNNGIYKSRILLKSIYPSRTDWENAQNGNAGTI